MDTLSAAMLLLTLRLQPPMMFEHRAPMVAAQTIIPLNPPMYTYIRLGGDLVRLGGMDDQIRTTTEIASRQK